MNGCSEIKWQNVSLSNNNKKIIASKIINWKNKKKKSLTTFFDVIPKSKIPSIHMKKTETTDLKWIDGREVGLRRSAACVWGRWRRGSEADWWLGTAGGLVTLSFGGGEVEDESSRQWWNREVRVWESELERVLRDESFKWEWRSERGTMGIKECKKINQRILF